MQGARASNPRQRASTSWYQDGSYTRQKAAGTSEGAFGLHGPCVLCIAKLSESSQYGKALDRCSPGRLAKLLVLRVPHFTASRANPGGRALRSAGFLSYTRIQAGFGESSPTRCLQIHQVKFPHTAGRLAGWSGLEMSFTPPTVACWGYPCRLNQIEQMQAHLEGTPWPAQGCHLSSQMHCSSSLSLRSRDHLSPVSSAVPP